MSIFNEQFEEVSDNLKHTIKFYAWEYPIRSIWYTLDDLNCLKYGNTDITPLVLQNSLKGLQC